MEHFKQTSVQSIEINKEKFQYKLRYSRKAKYMRLQISRNSGLELILPRGYQLPDAENFIYKKIDWIKKHLKSTEKTEKKFLFLGSEIKIRQEFQLFSKQHKVKFADSELIIASPAGSRAGAEKIYLLWLRSQAKEYLATRAYKLARENNFRINKVSVRGQKTRWGSCSVKGNLSFNFKLMQYEREVIDYVIFHELCHLKEMNHSKKFWELVEAHCPDYKLQRKKLKSDAGI